LPPELCTAVFRIFQETLTNVARHALASRVTVCIEEIACQLILRIEDNGRGVTEQQLNDPKSLGLAGMRERAMVLGGEFKIAAAPAGGTVANVRIPLSRGS
jgi:signal transduction histidine kinase